MKKGRIIVGLILNVLILLGAGFAVSNVYFGYWNCPPLGLEAFRYFTIDSNILLAVGALAMIVVDIVMLSGKKACPIVASIKLMGVVATFITAGFVVGYFWLYEQQPVEQLYQIEYNLFLHAIVPALGLISFIVENKPRMKPWAYAFLGMLPVLVYGGVMIPLVYNGTVVDPYNGILTIKGQELWVTIVWIASFLVGSYIIAFLILLLHNIGAKEQPVEAVEEAPEEAALPPVNQAEEAPVEEEKPEEEVPAEEEKPEEGEAEEEKPEEPVTVLAPRTAYAHRKLKKPAPKARTYHVTKQPNGQWQVKLAGTTKAIKLFTTQREAIAYARGLVESRGGSYRIHSVKGKIRS